jgi:hypothetical protein
VKAEPRKAWIVVDGCDLRECLATRLPEDEGHFLGMAAYRLDFTDGTNWTQVRECEVIFDELEGWKRIAESLDSEIQETQLILSNLKDKRARAGHILLLKEGFSNETR